MSVSFERKRMKIKKVENCFQGGFFYTYFLPRFLLVRLSQNSYPVQLRHFRPSSDFALRLSSSSISSVIVILLSSTSLL